MMSLNKYKLADIAKIEISGVDKKTIEGEIPVRLCNFVDVYYNWAITKEKAKSFMVASAKQTEIDKCSIGKGMVAITKDSETRDDIGVATYIADDFDNVVLGYHCALIIPNSAVVDGKYLNAFMHTRYIQKYFENNASGSGQRYTLSNDTIGNIPVLLPSIDEQHTIGKVLADIDRKIELNKRINDNLEAMAKQLYDYWFVQFDFPNEEGKPYKSSGGAMVWNEKLKREIPTSFVVKSLSEIIEVKDGTHDSPKPQDNGYFLLTSKHLTERGLDYASAYKISKEDYESINKRSKVDTNDILFSMIGTIGNSYFVEETNINFAIKNMALFKTSAKRWFSEYLYLYLSSCDYKHYEGNSLSGSIQKFVSLRTLRDMPILYHEDIIKVFAKEVRNIITMMVNLRKENIELTKQRDELLPLLMNGQAMVNYHLSAKAYPLPIAYKKAMPIEANQIISSTFIQKSDSHTPSPRLQTSQIHCS